MQKEKPPAGGFSNSIVVMDQTAINAASDLRRYAMKPSPAKPKIIIGHVECPRGTATAVETLPVPSPKSTQTR